MREPSSSAHTTRVRLFLESRPSCKVRACVCALFVYVCVLIFVCVRVCVCVYACMCAHMCAHVWWWLLFKKSTKQ